MIDIPLSQIGSAEQFAKDVQKHVEDLTAQMMGKPGVPAPIASSALVDAVIVRVPQKGPVAKRGPDQFVVLPYRVVDDLPPDPVSPAVQLLRETIQ